MIERKKSKGAHPCRSVLKRGDRSGDVDGRHTVGRQHVLLVPDARADDARVLGLRRRDGCERQVTRDMSPAEVCLRAQCSVSVRF